MTESPPIDVRAAVTAANLFQSFSDDVIDKVVSACEVRTMAANETVVPPAIPVTPCTS